jgi:hypothetical protein
MTSSGATAALAGYRKQFLFTLHTILSCGGTIQIEGREDLDRIDAEGSVIESVQVKAYGDALTLAVIQPFLVRFAEQAVTRPDLRGRLVSFGPLGPELDAAWAGAGHERTRVEAKLIAAGMDAAAARWLFDRVELEIVDEHAIDREVRAALGSLATAADADASFDLLMLWMYASAERSLRVDRDVLRERLDRVGRYVAERSVTAREWFTNIVPLERMATDARDNLEQEYREGVGARLEHIAAGLDVERPELMSRIDDAFAANHIVILRGASGQGKTTLALRWLYQHLDEGVAVEIREIRDHQHARELSLAIASYVRITGIAVTVFHDTRPGDTAWAELLREIPSLSNARLLVAIREDDWRRVTTDIPSVIFEEIGLTLEEAEARGIHRRLAERQAIPHIHDFEDAWTRFEGGPLLEFVYALTQTVTLRERLRGQLERLADDEAKRPGLLRLLRWTVIADAYGARLDARIAAQKLGLAEPSLVCARLEQEYLIRNEGGRLAGLHAVRSKLLVEIFETMDEGFTEWLDHAVALLPALIERDREIFLLHAFALRAPVRARLLMALDGLISPTWEGVRAVLRALTWLGVAQYVERNEELIDEVQQKEGTSWYIFLQDDLVNLSAITRHSTVDIFGSLGAPAESRRADALAWQARLRGSEQVLALARAWMERQVLPPPPVSVAEWSAAAESLFWAGHLGIAVDLHDAWLMAFDRDYADLEVRTLADFHYGLWRLGHTSMLCERHASIVERFRNEYAILEICDASPEITVDYLVRYESLQSEANLATFLNAESVARCEILYRLFPHYECWGARGVGHSFVGFAHDDSSKLLERAALPPMELVRLQGALYRLGDLRLRVQTWPEWCEQVLAQRRGACEGMEALLHGAEGYFRRPRPVQWSEAGLFDEPGFEQIVNLLFFGMPPFPRCAIDEWGFTSEGNTGVGSERLAAQQLGLRRHDPMRKAMAELLSSLRFFLQEARDAIAVQPRMAMATDAERKRLCEAIASQKSPNFPRNSLSLLFAAWSGLGEAQRLFREFAACHTDIEALAALEAREQRTYVEIFAQWFRFITAPGQVRRTQGTQAAVQALRQSLPDLRRLLPRLLTRDATLSNRVRLVNVYDRLPEAPGLWLVFDATVGPFDTHEIANSIIVLIHGVLPASDELDTRAGYVVRQAWEPIHIVTLVRGRLSAPTCVRVSALSLMANGPSCRRTPEALSPPAMSGLNLESWTHPLLEQAREQLAFGINLLGLGGYYHCISAHAGTMSSYVDDLGRQYDQTRSNLDDHHAQLAAELERIATTHPELHEDSAHIIAALNRPMDQIDELFKAAAEVWLATVDLVTRLP